MIEPGDFLLDDWVATPVPALRCSALAANIEMMASFCRQYAVDIAPHVKTTMSPALARLQLDAGAWGLTVANVGQARVLYQQGFSHLLIAFQVVNPSDIGWISERLRGGDAHLSCFVDSVAGVELLDTALHATDPPRTLPVLVELGMVGGRTGCRNQADLRAVAEAVASSRHLVLAGVAGFEGIIKAATPELRIEKVRVYLEQLRTATEVLLRLQMFSEVDEVVITAGGTAMFPLVAKVLGSAWTADVPVRPVLRSGCYVTHDHDAHQLALLTMQDAPALFPALEVWATVVSMPEPAHAYADAGRRHLSFDAGLPVVFAVSRRGSNTATAVDGIAVTELNDQHAYLALGGDDLVEIGDRIGLGISHPCTTFDKWRAIPLVDDRYSVIDVLETWFGLLPVKTP